MIRAFVLTALLAATAAAGAAQPIGRLFFTPAERAQLDTARANKRVAEPPSSKPAEPPRPETQIITYNGIIRARDGKSILWLNSRGSDEKEALSGLPVTGRVRPDGGITLQVPNTGGTIDLKVGQRAELLTGRVVENRPPEKEAADKGAKPDAAKTEAARGDAAKAGDAAKGEATKGPAAKGESAKAGETSTKPQEGAKGAAADKKGEPPKPSEAEAARRANAGEIELQAGR